LDTVRGLAWDELWPAEYRPRVKEAVQQARAGSEARFSGYSPTATGKPKWWDVCVSPIPGPDGEPVRLLAVSRDVTDSKRAQDEINQTQAEARAASDRLAEVLESTTDGVVLLDREWRVTYINPRATALLASRALTVGRLFWDAFPEEFNGNFHQRFLRVQDDQAPVKFDDYLASVGLWLETHAYPASNGGLSIFFHDITEQHAMECERAQAQERVAHMARHDALTGLANRLHFREQLDRSLDGLRAGTRITVLYLDLDGFKAVNDTHGHPIGDLLLRQVAERLQRCVRQGDLVARFGGDEFAVIQTSSYCTSSRQPDDAAVLADRLIAAIAEPYDLEGKQVMIATSVGIALAPRDGTGADDLIRRADLALYAAKAAGRGRYRLHEWRMDEELREKQALKADLRAAIEFCEFKLHYQPVLNLRTNRIACFEALLRWQHPQRGLVPPDAFISVAEENGLILPIGTMALRWACQEAAKWPEPIGVAVNLSPIQFCGADLISIVADVLATTNLAPERLELEITESVLLKDSDGNLAMLRKLKKLGVRIAMDDFGTGYSSLSYLHRFPFDKVKIDRSFVAELPHNRNSAAIVNAVMGIGASLGVTITAEGVETQAQLAYLRAAGCDQAQGFLFSKAVPKGEVAELIERLGGCEATKQSGQDLGRAHIAAGSLEI
jgi:diguanylate cyclase (GGDEF)-like protein